MKTRTATKADIEHIIEVEKLAWPVGGAATEDQFISRIDTFPEGVIVATVNDRIVGVVVGQRIDITEIENTKKTWAEITDSGLIKGTHNITGDSLFGVDLSVHPEFQKMGIGRKLLLEIGRLAVKNNLKYGLLGARMPDYYKYSKKISPDDYIKLRDNSGKLVDSELRFYEKAGLKLFKVLPNYFPDKDSLDYGVLAVWENPFYVKSKHLGILIGRIGSLLFKI